MSKKPSMTPAQSQFQLRSVIENNCTKMKEASALVMAVGRLMEAFAHDEVQEDVMSPLVIGGLAAGLMMLSTDLWTSVEIAESRTLAADQGGAQ
jgi:hypothetical protein